MENEKTFCGFVAIVGRPNVGKSTLINRFIQQKISITSRKAQTTRHRVLGIHTDAPYQTIFIDTPGLHQEEKRTINRFMNRAAASSLIDVDGIIMIVEGTKWKKDDELVLTKIKKQKNARCVILLINKVDLVKEKKELLTHMTFLQEQYPFNQIIPISIGKGDNIDNILLSMQKILPQNPYYYPEDYITDRSRKFMAAEIIREKLMRYLGDELPYSLTVEIEQFKVDTSGTYHINALILTERNTQKRMIIGKNGSKIKKIGQEARKDMETLFETKIFLETWIKVKSGWADDERALHNLGYGND